MDRVSRSPICPFCRRGDLEIVLMETPRLYVLVDNAPLTEGHLLIVPKEHWACYGGAPEAWDEELRSTKDQVARFLEQTYRPACFFEHGVYRQSVYHAHLHAFPLGAGAVSPDLASEAARAGGVVIQQQSEIRSWYADNGRYFYVEQAPTMESAGVAALFPAEDAIYFRILGQMIASAGRQHPVQSQALRRMTGGPRMRAVTDAWIRHHRSA